MSLVNEMLQDLQQRKAADSKPLAGLHAVPTATRPAEKRAGKRRWLVVLPVIAISVAFAAVALLSERVVPLNNNVQTNVDDDAPLVVTSDLQLKMSPLSGKPLPVLTGPFISDTGRQNDKSTPTGTGKMSVATIAIAKPKVVPVTQPVTVKSASVAPVAQPAQQAPGIVVKEPVSAAVRLRQAGLAALRSSRAVEAQRLFEKLVAVDPKNSESYLLLHAALKAQSSPAEGRRVLLDGLELSSEPARLAQVLASELLADGSVDMARSVLTAHRPARFADLEYEAQLAAVTQRAGHHEAATEIYQLLVNRQPANGVWWVGLGISQEASGYARDAAVSFSTAAAGGTLDATLAAYAARRLKKLESGS